jgi:hypothetical protein
MGASAPPCRVTRSMSIRGGPTHRAVSSVAADQNHGRQADRYGRRGRARASCAGRTDGTRQPRSTRRRLSRRHVPNPCGRACVPPRERTKTQAAPASTRGLLSQIGCRTPRVAAGTLIHPNIFVAVLRFAVIHRWLLFLSMSVDWDASHSLSFDQRRRPETLRTAIATALFWPTRTTSFLPRVTPV